MSLFRRNPAASLPVAIALFAVLILASPSARAQAGPPCPDILLGDSLAVGMGPYAQALGFEVIAQRGAGLNWLRAQEPRCARRLVLVFGTNDLRGMSGAEAQAYPARVAEILAKWEAAQAIWATPGCFTQDDALERGSVALDRVLAQLRRQASDQLRDLPAINSGRQSRCSFPSRDGIHPSTGVAYQAWWAGLAEILGRHRLAGA
ncbi:SGNH/GDSL hydrolase family protein [Roseococcus sp. SYP-B2431]|uniref:SGNH/GDSL hydrolase family protein n=1 Tax=Roseococcus sp. SYP-B2431 TaxID=2496640 RepID=UPI00103BD9B6|nr:SGNH/GDSL hydrolase family protein [Roseococcus sp. SYP-B2431]TCH96383.1 SGNH/GDSL hydrolase family protein [Roseococcus sp. SYP-B2431]